MINVFILTFCRNPQLLYGAELIFKTLRVGFPTAKVTVVDNASIAEAVARIEPLSQKNGCTFKRIPAPGIQHYEFIERSIREMAEEQPGSGPVVFLDPDICFWKNCEDFDCHGLIAGKMCSGYDESLTQTFAMPRLHSSFLWIPSAEKLMAAIRKIRAVRFDFEPFQPYSCVVNGTWFRFDTGANLCNALADEISPFSEDYLDRYDHLFAGSHFDWVYPKMDKNIRSVMAQIHAAAREGNLEALKGIGKTIDRIMNPYFGVAAKRI